jgi:hypothetical protein
MQPHNSRTPQPHVITFLAAIPIQAKVNAGNAQVVSAAGNLLYLFIFL